MLRLEIHNSECRFIGLPMDKHKSLKKKLSYRISEQSHFFSGGFGSREKSLLAKDGTFPSGLLYIALEWLRKNNLRSNRVDLRKRPEGHPGLFKLNLG